MPEVGDTVNYTNSEGETSEAEVTHVHDSGQRNSLVDLSNGETGVVPGDPGALNTYCTSEQVEQAEVQAEADATASESEQVEQAEVQAEADATASESAGEGAGSAE